MDSIVMAAIISASVTVIGILFAYLTWRRDVRIKLQNLREQVSVELIRQRIRPYVELMKQLEIFSSLRKEEFLSSSNKIEQAINILQNAIYGKPGLIASHQTRPLLLFVRLGCMQFKNEEISIEELIHRVWALEFSLRSDIGIPQPMWESEVERIHKETSKRESGSNWERAWENVVKDYPWPKLDLRYK